MAMNEWGELLRVLNASGHEREPDASLLAMLMRSFGTGEGLDTSFLPSQPSGGTVASRDPVAELAPALSQGPGARGLESFVFAPPAPVASSSSPNSGTAPVAEPQGSSAAMAAVKTIGMATGVGPIVMGLMKLFGGGSDANEDVVPALSFSLPEQISVEAGLQQDRSFVPVSYSQRGVARSMMPIQNEAPAAAQINVNVQAMDSRSFLDHSDEIARAVRDAMLRSHSLNDVVAEL